MMEQPFVLEPGSPERDYDERRASALVEPLHITKSPPRSQSSTSFRSHHTRPSSTRTQRTGSLRSHGNMSPPLTPRTSRQSLPERRDSHHAAFHNYLRAFHHFHPGTSVSSDEDESSITVSIEQGDVILVHSVHPNGWADGTILETGARGWLPTNYCEAFEHDSIRSLLSALTNLWDLVRCYGEEVDVDMLGRQDCVRPMIAGVRIFLVRANPPTLVI